MDLMMWASERGQMLSRTVKGMMMYGSALRQLELLEAPDASLLQHTSAADGKFRCVLWTLSGLILQISAVLNQPRTERNQIHLGISKS